MNIVFAELKSIPYSNLTVVIDSPTPPLTPLYGLHHRIVCVLKSSGQRGRMSLAVMMAPRFTYSFLMRSGGNESLRVWSPFCKVVSVAQSDLQAVQIQGPYGPE